MKRIILLSVFLLGIILFSCEKQDLTTSDKSTVDVSNGSTSGVCN